MDNLDYALGLPTWEPNIVAFPMFKQFSHHSSRILSTGVLGMICLVAMVIGHPSQFGHLGLIVWSPQPFILHNLQLDDCLALGYI